MERSKPSWWWQGLLAVTVLGFSLRVSHLDQRYLWYDEALLLQPSELAGTPLQHAMTVWKGTTYNPGWAFVVWAASRIPGDTLLIARLASLVVGTLAIPAAAWAALSLGLKRGPAFAAALLTAVSWPLIDYSQQILPHAPMPLLSFTVIALLGSIGRMDPAAPLRRSIGAHAALAGVCLLYVLIHNSFLLVLPLIGTFLAANFVVPRRDEIVVRSWRSRLIAASLAFSTLAIVLIPAAVFFLAKREDGFRVYLRPFYFPTFQTGDNFTYLGLVDDWYTNRGVLGVSRAFDVAYFSVTRTVDWLAYELAPYYASSHTVWWLGSAFPGLALCVLGSLSLLRGRAGRTAALCALGGLAAVGATLMLSLFKLYPYGGLRHMLPLAPLILLATAFAGWHAVARSPKWAGVLLGCILGVVVLSTTEYAQENQTTVNEIGIRVMAKRVQTTTIVAGDGEWSAGVLRVLCRHSSKLRVVEPGGPEFDAVLKSRKPFLLVSKAGPSFKQGKKGWVVNESFVPILGSGFDIKKYDVEILRIEHINSSSRGAVAYAVRPLRTKRSSPEQISSAIRSTRHAE